MTNCVWKNIIVMLVHLLVLVCEMFNVHDVKDVGQAEIHTAEPLVLEPSAAEGELAINKPKSRQLLIKYRQN